MRTVTAGAENSVEVLHEIGGAGYSLRLARKRVRSHVTYRHALDTQLLHVTLAGAMKGLTGHFGSGRTTGGPSRPGMVCFTPAGWERTAVLERGEVTAAEVELDEAFVAEACERPVVRGGGNGFFNVADGKATALVRALVDPPCGDATMLVLDMVAVALARHVGFGMLGCAKRADDGWLHPAALRRVIGLVEAEPGRAVRLNELAVVAGLGCSAFIRAFRGATGMTPAAFVLERRLFHASAAIRADKTPLATIAADFGFSSKAHLITAYRRRFGVTPGRHRLQS